MYVPVIALAIIAAGFAVFSVVMSTLVGPKRYNRPKLDSYECGIEPTPQALGGGHRFDPWGMWGPQVPKPVVLAVSGISFTLSIELALASDIVVASETVRFRQLEISRGIIPFGGATMRGPARLGWGNAMLGSLAEPFPGDARVL